MIESLEDIISDLRAGPIEELGLSPAIEFLVEKMLARCGRQISVDLHIEAAVNMDSEQELAIYRVVQESVSNIIRHSEATSVQINLFTQSSQAVLTIQDNGIGMPKQDRLKDSAFGIMGMRERIDFFGGTFNIKGLPKEGTLVKVTLPLKQKDGMI